METFFNVLWVLLTLALGLFWANGLRRSTDRKSALPGIGVQMVALVMLAFILLPAISLTDDLQACTAPAEVEHLARRDGPFIADQTPHALPLALAMLVAQLEPAPAGIPGSAAEEAPAPRRVSLYSPSLAKRPPPLA